jgi:hypothetical protein
MSFRPVLLHTITMSCPITSFCVLWIEVFFFDALANQDHVDHHDGKDNQTF